MSGLGSRAGVALAGAGLFVIWGSLWPLATTASAAQPIRDWPCDRPYAEHFAAEDIWGGRLPGPLPGDWQKDPGVREVVEFAADPENTPNQGGAQIRAFATQRGADRRPALLGVFAGLLEEFDSQREIVIEGVRDSIVRAKIVREAVDKNEAAIAALSTDPGPATEQQRKDQKEARFWNDRYLDDSLDQARFLCHRYGYIEVKLRRLSAAVRAAW